MKNNKHTQPPTSLSETGGDAALTASERAKSRQHKAVKPALPTHAYKGRTASERAKDRAHANGLK